MSNLQKEDEESKFISKEYKEFLKEIQIKFSRLREEKSFNLNAVNYLAGLDVAYTKDEAFGVCIVTSIEGDVLEKKVLRTKIPYQYIPGFLFLREAPIMISLIRMLDNKPDIIFVDGHGIAHPRKAGLAVFVGILSDLPCVGIAKRLLYGKVGESILKLYNESKKVEKIIEPILDLRDQELIGFKISKVNEKVYYASVGNIIKTQDLLAMLSMFDYSYPLCLKLADKASKEGIKDGREARKVP